MSFFLLSETRKKGGSIMKEEQILQMYVTFLPIEAVEGFADRALLPYLDLESGVSCYGSN